MQGTKALRGQKCDKRYEKKLQNPPRWVGPQKYEKNTEKMHKWFEHDHFVFFSHFRGPTSRHLQEISKALMFSNTLEIINYKTKKARDRASFFRNTLEVVHRAKVHYKSLIFRSRGGPLQVFELNPSLGATALERSSVTGPDSCGKKQAFKGGQSGHVKSGL